MKTNITRYSSIDISKLFFAYLILIAHVFVVNNVKNDIVEALIILIDIVVPVFFLMSGFFLYNHISNNLDKKKIIIKKYLKRIVIMYLIWETIMFVFRIPNIIRIGINLKQQAIYWIKFFRVLILIGDYQLWYLIGLVWAVLIFYALFRNNSLKGCIVIAVLLWMLRIVLNVYYDSLVSSSFTKYLMHVFNIIFGTTRNGFFTGFPFLIAGCLFAKYQMKLLTSRIKKKLVIIASIALVVLYVGSKMNKYYLLSNTLLALTVAAVFLAILLFKNSFNSKKYSDLSTIIYLSHMFFVILVSNICFSTNINNGILFVIIIGITTIFSLIILRMSRRFWLIRKMY